MPTSFVAFLAVFGAIAIAAGPGFVLYRNARFRKRVCEELATQGYDVRELSKRWFTRGVFPDIPLPGFGQKRRREYLFRVFATDRTGRPQSGWVRWRVPLWWHRSDQWAVKWDDIANETTKGTSSLVFYAILLVAIAVVVILLTRTEQFAIFVRTITGGA